MHPDLVPLLRCPRSGQPLSLERPQYRQERIWQARLRSPAGFSWPIRDGIADLLDGRAAWNGAQLLNRLPLAAWGYERLWRPRALSLLSGRPFSLMEELATLVDQLQPERGGIYLDLACSTGVYGRAMARTLPPHSGHVISLDHSWAMLRETQRRAQAEGVTLNLVRALAENLPFADGVIAGIGCGGSLNEFTNPDRVLSEARRTLKADGRSLWMQARQAPTTLGRITQALLGPGGVQFWEAERLIASLASAGLRTTLDVRTGAIQIVATEGRILWHRPN